jgi:HSP20 family protein
MAKNHKSEEKAVTKTNPAGTALSPFEEMDRLFEEFMGQRWPRAWMRPFRWEHPAWADMSTTVGKVPRVDVIDGDAVITVHAEIPGVKKEDLDVSVNEDTVTIRGRSSHEERSESDSYFRSEIARGEFVRTVALPGAVDASKAKAKVENGVLELTLPKVEKAKRHAIKVE